MEETSKEHVGPDSRHSHSGWGCSFTSGSRQRTAHSVLPVCLGSANFWGKSLQRRESVRWESQGVILRAEGT